MIVEIDESSGFCFGVNSAVKKAEQLLNENVEFYCLGQIVHNEMEVERLEQQGMKTIDYNEYKEVKNATILLRAHGEPPLTYQIAKENNIKLIDATCPIVNKFQLKVKTTFDKKNDTEQIVIFGNKTHPEIIGLIGQADEYSIIIEKLDDINKIDFDKPINLYSQTTKSVEAYEIIKNAIQDKLIAKGNEGFLTINKTLCKQVYGRNSYLQEFAKKHDVIIFISGKNSSNGKMLFNICKSENKRSYFITETNELKQEWILDSGSVGVSGATSTPKWQLEEIRDKIQMIVV